MGGSNQFILLLGAAAGIGLGIFKGFKFSNMMSQVAENLKSVTGAIVILLFVGSIRIIPFLYFITNSNEPAYNQLLFFSIVSSIVVIPLFYIYLNSLILIKPRKWYYHMIIPLLVIILLIAVDSVSRLHFGLFISSYYLLYIISSVILVVKFLREKPNNLIRSAFVKNVKEISYQNIFNEVAVGTGPFKLKSWLKNSNLKHKMNSITKISILKHVDCTHCTNSTFHYFKSEMKIREFMAKLK